MSSTLRPGVAQRLARAAGRNELDAVAGERAGEFDDAGFVGDGNEGARGAAQMLGHGLSSTLLSRFVVQACTAGSLGCYSHLLSRFVEFTSFTAAAAAPLRARGAAAAAAVAAAPAGLLKAPDHARRRSRLAADDHLHRAARPVIAGEIDAVLELRRGASPALKVHTSLFGDHQHDAVAVGQPRRLDRGMQMEAHRIVVLAGAQLRRRRRRQGTGPRPRAAFRRRRASSVRSCTMP